MHHSGDGIVVGRCFWIASANGKKETMLNEEESEPVATYYFFEELLSGRM